MNVIYVLAAGIGFVAGLRSLTAPAAVSWAACLGWLNLQGSPLAFLGSQAAVVIFSLLAAAELVVDKLPRTPSRTRAGPLMTRIVLGGLAGAGISVAGGEGLLPGMVLGGLGSVIGAFAGYQARRRLVARVGVKDAAVAVVEDLVTIGLAYLIVSSA
jgi:uncharacterized membrane protein